MTKTLYLMRHAHALNTKAGETDKDRSLSTQGVEDARALGHVMKEKNYVPSLALYSTSTRTTQTCSGVLEAMREVENLGIDRLYNASAETLFEEISLLEDSYDSVLVVGHNPGVPDLIYKLFDPNSESTVLDRLMQGYRPATLSVLSCPIQSWNDLALKQNMLLDVIEAHDFHAPPRPTRWM